MNATQSAAAKGTARVLIVEDQFMSALALVQAVEQLGGKVVGPAPTVEDALRLLEAEKCDAALLDINLGSETVEPVAERLESLGCPFVFVSGYASPKLIHPRFKSRRMISKPVDARVLKNVLRSELGL